MSSFLYIFIIFCKTLSKNDVLEEWTHFGRMFIIDIGSHLPFLGNFKLENQV